MKKFQENLKKKIKKHQTHCQEEPILLRQQDIDAVGMHFSADNHHGTEDLIIRVLDGLVDRLKVEKEWIYRRCQAPVGLNILD